MENWKREIRLFFSLVVPVFEVISCSFRKRPSISLCLDLMRPSYSLLHIYSLTRLEYANLVDLL